MLHKYMCLLSVLKAIHMTKPRTKTKNPTALYFFPKAANMLKEKGALHS